MPERVLANPLSGGEIRRAILDKISQRLAQDGFLNENLAYDTYDARIKISLTAHDVGRAAPVNLEVHDSGATADAPSDDAALDAADAEFEIDAAAPNEVRVDSGQDVPVLTRDEKGNPAIKGVRYSRKQLEKAQK